MIAKNAGLAIDLDQMRELTGYELEKAPETPSPSPFPGLNSATPLQTALQGVAKREEASGTDARTRRRAPEGDFGDFREGHLARRRSDQRAPRGGSPRKTKNSKLIADLPSLIPKDPALAAVIAAEFGSPAAPAPSGAALNSDDCRAKAPAHCPTHGTPGKPATEDEIKSFLSDPPTSLSPDMADALLSAVFDDKDGEGNTVKYGSLPEDHLERESHSEKD